MMRITGLQSGGRSVSRTDVPFMLVPRSPMGAVDHCFAGLSTIGFAVQSNFRVTPCGPAMNNSPSGSR